MADANQLADDVSGTVENVFPVALKDQLEALVAVRGTIDHARRLRLFAALHRIQEQAHNTLAALTRDAAWS